MAQAFPNASQVCQELLKSLPVWPPPPDSPRNSASQEPSRGRPGASQGPPSLRTLCGGTPHPQTFPGQAEWPYLPVRLYFSLLKQISTRAVSGPSALLGPEMVKFASNFCYCAVDQEKAVFQSKRVVSGPSALLGPEMVKFASNFCYCAVDQEKVVFSMETGRFLPICPFGARNGQICFEFLLLC